MEVDVAEGPTADRVVDPNALGINNNHLEATKE